MDINGKTSIIDSDFRAGAIFYSLTSGLLFSFAVTNTAIYAKLLQKNNNLEGVNMLAMLIISSIVTLVSGALLIFSIYKLIMVREKRDKIEQDLHKTVPKYNNMEPPPPENPPLRNLRDTVDNNNNRIKYNINNNNYNPEDNFAKGNKLNLNTIY